MMNNDHLKKLAEATARNAGYLVITAEEAKEVPADAIAGFDVQVHYQMESQEQLQAMLVNVMDFFWDVDKETWDKALLQFAHARNLITTTPDGRQMAMLHKKGEHEKTESRSDVPTGTQEN